MDIGQRGSTYVGKVSNSISKIDIYKNRLTYYSFLLGLLPVSLPCPLFLRALLRQEARNSMLIHTVSVRLQPRGSIFQCWFLGEVQLKKSLKKGTFWPKNGVLFKKKPKNRTFEKGWGYIQEWGCTRADTVCIYVLIYFSKFKVWSKAEFLLVLSQL